MYIVLITSISLYAYILTLPIGCVVVGLSFSAPARVNELFSSISGTTLCVAQLQISAMICKTCDKDNKKCFLFVLDFLTKARQNGSRRTGKIEFVFYFLDLSLIYAIQVHFFKVAFWFRGKPRPIFYGSN